MYIIYKSLIAVGSVFISLYAFSVYAFLELGIAVHPMMNANFKAHPIGIYFHIFPSLIALVLGPFQFNEKLRTTKTHIHRIIGKIYIASNAIHDITTDIQSVGLSALKAGSTHKVIMAVNF